MAPKRNQLRRSNTKKITNLASEKKIYPCPRPLLRRCWDNSKSNSKQGIGRNEISVNTTKIYSHTLYCNTHTPKCSLKYVCMRIWLNTSTRLCMYVFASELGILLTSIWLLSPSVKGGGTGACGGGRCNPYEFRPPKKKNIHLPAP